jgi:hypothetical protein
MSKRSIKPTDSEAYTWKNRTASKLQTELKLCMHVINFIITNAEKDVWNITLLMLS